MRARRIGSSTEACRGRSPSIPHRPRLFLPPSVCPSPLLCPLCPSRWLLAPSYLLPSISPPLFLPLSSLLDAHNLSRFFSRKAMQTHNVRLHTHARTHARTHKTPKAIAARTACACLPGRRADPDYGQAPSPHSRRSPGHAPCPPPPQLPPPPPPLWPPLPAQPPVPNRCALQSAPATLRPPKRSPPEAKKAAP